MLWPWSEYKRENPSRAPKGATLAPVFGMGPSISKLTATYTRHPAFCIKLHQSATFGEIPSPRSGTTKRCRRCGELTQAATNLLFRSASIVLIRDPDCH